MDDSVKNFNASMSREECVHAGHKLRCPICGNNKFSKRKSLLNTRFLTFFKLDWANQGAINYICNQCGHIIWFQED